MHLRDYLEESGQSQEVFGQKLSPPVRRGKVNKWLQGRIRVSLREALQVHVLCSGRVSLQELADLYRGNDDEECGCIPPVSVEQVARGHVNAGGN